MAWDSAVFTNSGIRMLNQTMEGDQIRLDYATGGEGTVNPAALMAQTELAAQKQVLKIVDIKDMEGGKRVNIQVNNVGVETGYNMQQVGIWGHLGDAEPELVAILQDDGGARPGINVPAETEMKDFALNFYAVLKVSGEGTFTLEVDPSALVSMGTLTELLECKADLINGKINPDQLPFGGLPVVQTEGSGEAYTASVDGITELTKGTAIIMIPHSTSAVNAPTLDLNGLGAKAIRRAISTTSSGASAGYSQGWIAANRPMLLIFNGTYWVDQGRTRPYASDLSGTVGIDHGGTGATTAENARAMLEAAAEDHKHNAADITGTLPIEKGGTGRTDGAVAALFGGDSTVSYPISFNKHVDTGSYIPIAAGNEIKAIEADDLRKTFLGIKDYITNEGFSGYWHYRIWASGVKECWASNLAMGSISVTRSNGALYNAANYLSINLPFITNKDTELGYASVVDNYLQNSVWVPSVYIDLSVGNLYWYLVATSSQNVNHSYNVYCLIRPKKGATQ